MIKEMNGVTLLFSETGTEGGWWAMQEDGFLEEDGIHWKYEGLHELKENDEFTVYDSDGNILWTGIIHQDKETNLQSHSVFRKGKWVVDKTWKQQVVDNMWVHWLQSGVDPETWSDLFVDNKRCLLKREENEV